VSPSCNRSIPEIHGLDMVQPAEQRLTRHRIVLTCGERVGKRCWLTVIRRELQQRSIACGKGLANTGMSVEDAHAVDASQARSCSSTKHHDGAESILTLP
jgi:hypothetical protein